MEMMEVENGEVETEQNGLNLFSRLPLTEALPLISRDLSYHSVLQVEEPTWETLRGILTHNRSNTSDHNGGDDEAGQNALEIFSISWPPHMKQSEMEANIPKVSYLLSECDQVEEVDIVSTLKESRILLLRLVLRSPESYTLGQSFALVELDGVDDDNLTEQFNQLCKIGYLTTIHWFSAFQHGFMWRKSQGSTMQTIAAKCSSIEYTEQRWFNNLNADKMNTTLSGCIFPKNIICISGVAGNGKSALLARTSLKLKKMFKNRRICFIDLNLLSSLMIGMKVNTTLKPLNFELFLQLICEYFEINSDLEKDDLKGLLSPTRGNWDSSPKLELLLNSLHEMNKEMCEVLLTFLQNECPLDNWNFRVWITTRSHLKHKVEDMLSVVAFNLKTVCPTDISAYLQSCETTDGSDHGRIKEILSSRLEDHLKLDLKRLISIPARLTVFQSFQKGKQLYNLNGMGIIKEMIKNAKEQYKQVKCDSSREKDPDHLLRKHVPLACQTILRKIQSNTCRKSGESQRDHLRLENAIFQVEYELLDFGLVEKYDNGKLHFVNDAFATFILADYYTSHLPSSDLLIDFFLRFLFFRDECEQVRLFYAQRLHDGVDIEVNDAWSDHLTNFMISTYRLSDDNPCCPSDCGNLLQLLIIDQKLAIAKMILREFLPSHPIELKNLIGMKVKVELNSLKVGGSPTTNYIELSALSLAIMFGDPELLHLMYSYLGEEPDVDEDMEDFSHMDAGRFTPVHLAVLGCNLKTLSYLGWARNMSINKLDFLGHLPLHLVFYNGWDMKFCFLEPSSTSFSSPSSSSSRVASLPPPQYVFRQIQIRKYYNDLGEATQLTDDFTVTPDRIGQFPTIASKLEMTNEHREFLQMQMKKKINFHHKPRENPSEMVYYNNISSYNIIVERLTGRTPLNYHNKVEGISALVEPPFHMACAGGYLPLVESMVKQKVKINIKGKNDSTALLLAILQGNLHIVKYLLGLRGIDKRDLDKLINNKTPLLHQISSMNLSKMVEFFIKDLGQSVNMKSDEGLTPLHVVSSVHSDLCLETAKVLLKMGAVANEKDKNMLTPLMHACRTPAGNDNNIAPNFELIKLLIENGADVNAQNRKGESPLHFAVTGNSDLVKHLLTCGGGNRKINVNIKTTSLGEGGTRAGSTPLHYACKKRGNVDILKHLIAAGARVNAEDSLSQIPIQMVVSAEAEEIDEEMAKLLVQHKAWMLHRNKLGKTAFNVLALKKRDFAEFLFNQSNMVLLNAYHEVSSLS